MKKAVSSGYIVAWSEYLSVFQFCISNKQGTPRITDHLLPLFFHWETNKKNSVNSLLPTELISSSRTAQKAPHSPMEPAESPSSCPVISNRGLCHGASCRLPNLDFLTAHSTRLVCPALPLPLLHFLENSESCFLIQFKFFGELFLAQR